MFMYHIRQNFRGENFRSCAQKKYTIHAWEKFHGASGRGHHVIYTASDSRGKLLQSTEKPQKSSYSKILPYMVY